MSKRFHFYCLFLIFTFVLFNCKVESSPIETKDSINLKEPTNAKAPIITSQPTDATVVLPGTGLLAVIAESSDGGQLSYQWYLFDDNSQQGVLIENAFYAVLKIEPTNVGRNGYYCVITNTISDNGDGGVKSSSINSEIAYIDAKYLKDIVPAPTFVKQPVSMNIAPHGGTVTLSCKVLMVL